MAGPYSAGSVFLDIVPSFRRFGESEYYRDAQRAGRAVGEGAGEGFDEGFEKTAGKNADKTIDKALGPARDRAEKSGEEAGRKFTGAFQKQLHASIGNATKALGDGIDDELDGVRKKLERIKVKIGGEFDSREVMSEFEGLMKTLKARSAKDLTLEAHFNTSQAIKEGERLHQQLKTALRPIEMNVDLDQSKTLKGVMGLRAAAEKITAKPIDLLVKANEGEALRGLMGLRAAGERIMAKPIDMLVKPDSVRSLMEAAALRKSLDQILGNPLTAEVEVEAHTENARRELARIQQEAKLLKAEIEIGIDSAEARARLTALSMQAERLDGKNVTIETRAEILGTVAQLAMLERSLHGNRGASVDAANAFRSFSGILLGVAALGPLVVPALAAITGGVLALGAAGAGIGAGLGVTILGFSGIGDALKAMGDQHKNAEKDAASNAQRQATYARTLRSASNGVRDAEISLARARETAADSAKRAARQVQNAVQGQRDAEEQLRRAQVDARQAQERLTEARRQAEDQLEDMALRARGGALAERQAVIDLAKAQREFNKAKANPTDYTKTEREQIAINLEREKLGLEQVRLENSRLAEEQAEVAKTGIEGMDVMVRAREQVASADERVIAAQRGVADAAVAVRDAVEAQSRQQRDSQYAIEAAQRQLTDAQVRYQEALFQTGDIGSSSMQKLEDAMDKLSPAGQRFATFLFGLRDEWDKLREAAAEGLLPGVQQALETLLPYLPAFTDFVGRIGGVMGDMFVRLAESLTSPVWLRFFDMVDEYAPRFIEQWFTIGDNIMKTIAGILTAMAPFAEEFGDALIGLTESWVEWATTLDENEGFQEFLAYLREAGPDVWKFLVALAGALLNLAIALAPYADDLLAFFTGFLNWIGNMDPQVLGGITIAILGLVLAAQAMFGIATLFMSTGVLATAFGALGTLLTTGAVAAGTTMATIGAIAGAVVAALILLGLAIWWAWNNVDWFREGVIAAWEWIQEAASAVATWFTDTLVPALNRVWDAIVEHLTWVWDTFLKPTFDMLQAVWNIIWSNIKWVWENIGKPIFELFGRVVGILWDNIIKPIWWAISSGFEAMAAVFSWIWKSVLGPVFELFRAIVQALWDRTLGPVFGWISDNWAVIAAAMEWVWDHTLKPIFDAFMGVINDHLVPIFEAAMSTIGSVWSNLVELARQPIKFVVETIINDGLVAGFNWLARAFGTTEIEPLKLPASFYAQPKKVEMSRSTGYKSGSRGVSAYATGGPVQGWSPTPTADNIPAMLTAGEYVLPVASTKRLRQRYGDQFLEHLRSFGDLPGFASGGLVGFGRKLQQMGYMVAEHPAFGGVAPVHTKNSLHYSGQAIDVNWAPGTSAAEQAKLAEIVPLAKEYGLRSIFMVKGHFGHAHFDTGKSGDMLGSLFNAALKGFANIGDFLLDKIEGSLDKIGAGQFGKILTGMPRKVLDWAVEKLEGWLAQSTDVKTEGLLVGDAKNAQDAVRQAAGGYGWDQGGMWQALSWIVNRESSWNPNAKNPNSTAYGLFQFLDGTWASTGFDKSSDPNVQAAAGMAYIRERYGNPVAAKIFHQRMGWYSEGGEVAEGGAAPAPASTTPYNGAMMYDSGGYLPPGLTTVLNLTGRPEPVFTADQFEKMQAGGGGDNYQVSVGMMPTDATPSDVADAVLFELRKIRRGGVHARRRAGSGR